MGDSGQQIPAVTRSLVFASKLYPFLEDIESHLPSNWSSQDKHNFISLTNNNLAVHYNGRHNISQSDDHEITESFDSNAFILIYLIIFIGKLRVFCQI